jgi:parvulin-like peptidyl-prolyl isomerase
MSLRSPQQRLLIQFVLIMMLFLSASSTASQFPRDGSVLVRIDNEVVTVKDFQEMTGQLPMVLRAGLETEQGRREALDWIIDSKLMLAEALQRGAEKEPEVQARIAAARQSIILSEYFSRLAKEKISVSDAELYEYYTKNREAFKLSDTVRVSHILLRSETEAHETLQELKRGADFSRLAHERSLDPSRRNGGQMGWLERSVMAPEFAAAVSRLTQSEMSGVVHTDFGYHIIRLDETRPLRARPAK